MNLRRMFKDELIGFFRSKVMIALWVGIPVLVFVIRMVQPKTEGIPVVFFVAIIVASIGGTLSAAILSTSIANERTRHVYELYLIRPVTRCDLLLAKFFAALVSLLVAVALSLVVGIVADVILGTFSVEALKNSGESVAISIAGIAVATSVGVLFGTTINSVAVSAILSVYVGNQLASIVVLPAILIESVKPLPLALSVGIALPALVLFAAIKIFERKAL